MSRHRQRGLVLMLLLLMLLVAGVTLLVTARAPGDAERASRDGRSARLLGNARDAVVAYAGFGGTNAVKGALPCPDFAAPGDPAAGTSGPECINGSASVYLARLPWRTIDVNARAGGLWYAIDADYRDEQSEVEPLNPSTPGSLQVDSTGGYVAVVIVPGDPLAGQTGRPGTAVADYLEGANADGDEAFVDCEAVAGCNDRVAGIRADVLWDPVQRRVLGEVEAVLRQFHQDSAGSDPARYLPWAAALGTTDCDSGRHSGRPPTTDGDCGESLDTADFPGWILSNDWLDFVVYHVDDDCTSASTGCAAGTLELGGSGGLDAIVAGAGRALAGQSRGGGSTVADYLDAPENTDGDARYEDGPLAADDNDALRGLELP